MYTNWPCPIPACWSQAVNLLRQSSSSHKNLIRTLSCTNLKCIYSSIRPKVSKFRNWLRHSGHARNDKPPPLIADPNFDKVWHTNPPEYGLPKTAENSFRFSRCFSCNFDAVHSTVCGTIYSQYHAVFFDYISAILGVYAKACNVHDQSQGLEHHHSWTMNDCSTSFNSVLRKYLERLHR